MQACREVQRRPLCAPRAALQQVTQNGSTTAVESGNGTPPPATPEAALQQLQQPTAPNTQKPLVGLPENTYEKIQDCVRYVRTISTLVPEIVIVLGSGLGAIADEMEDAVSIPYGDIPHFHAPGVAGHPGRLVLGRMKGVPALVLQGRFHYYEGHPMGEWAEG